MAEDKIKQLREQLARLREALCSDYEKSPEGRAELKRIDDALACTEVSSADERLRIQSELLEIGNALSSPVDLSPWYRLQLCYRIKKLVGMTNDQLEIGHHPGKFCIPVAVLEFFENGKTIWIHDDRGFTILRLAVRGGVSIDNECTNLSAHADIEVNGPVEICIPRSSLEGHYESM
jgi:hypothetical protein